MIDAGGSDGQVVDVRPAAGDPPVMQQPECLRSEPVELASESLLPPRSDVPGLGGLAFLGHGEDEAAQFRVLGPHAIFAPCLAAFELSTGRGSRIPALLLGGLQFHWLTVRVNASR